jgi:hypothetical protein
LIVEPSINSLKLAVASAKRHRTGLGHQIFLEKGLDFPAKRRGGAGSGKRDDKITTSVDLAELVALN